MLTMHVKLWRCCMRRRVIWNILHLLECLSRLAIARFLFANVAVYSAVAFVEILSSQIDERLNCRLK